ncbi:hypothetical protein [Ornithinimicrobium cerasi]|uniref:hypothetical protein n=1 Tax=Ornithinimicrobium cerasi TaxID=2248773 RepID=UPI0013798FEE|nr:hypothetical protein [Ornithinimicrobium cerasi]
MEEMTGRGGRADTARPAMLVQGLGVSGDVPHGARWLTEDVVPPRWRDHAVVGLDGVVRVRWLRRVDDVDDVQEGVAGAEGAGRAEVAGTSGRAEGTEVPVRERPSADLFALAAPFLGGTSSIPAEECLTGIEAMHVLMSRMAAGRLHAAGELAARAAEVLLEEEGVADPDELSRTRREDWRRRAKMTAGQEIAALTGWGRGKSRELVAIALTPRTTRRAVDQALHSGIASWWQVDKFWRDTRMLPHEDAALVARALFATDPQAADAAVERLDPEGSLTSDPWQDALFVKALAREIARARGADAEAEARRRAARRQERDAFALIDDDGEGQVVVRGDAATSAACADRLHLLATTLRQGGDGRTVAQLRADLAHALLLHGVLPLGGQEATGGVAGTVGGVETASGGVDEGDRWGDDLIAPEELERLAQVLTGTPSYHLQVIVPWDTLTGQPWLSGSCVCGGGGEGTQPTSPPRSSAPARSPGPRRREGVGHVLSRTPVFLTGAALRAMALAPGTTFSRILVDPADGRCVERSVARYQPDRLMREQILAADVTSRGFGSATLARDSQLDHVLEYLAGGETSETNLQALDVASHLRKTRKEWAATIGRLRDVTWTSFFGRVYRTRVHDYRQYLSTGVSQVEAGESTHPGNAVGLRAEDRRQLASWLTYAALTARQVGAPLEASDDDPDGDDTLPGRRHPAVWLRRTRERDGRKISGPRPGTPTPEQVISVPASTILRAAHWTDPFTEPDPAPRTTTWNAQDDPPPF